MLVEELGVAPKVELQLAAGALDDGVGGGVVLAHVVDQLVAEPALVVAQPAQEPAQAVLATVVVGDDPARVPPQPLLQAQSSKITIYFCAKCNVCTACPTQKVQDLSRELTL